jgi:hypothetical protein
MRWSDIFCGSQKLCNLVATANNQNRAGLSVKDARPQYQYGDIHNRNWPDREGDREALVGVEEGDLGIFDIIA